MKEDEFTIKLEFVYWNDEFYNLWHHVHRDLKSEYTAPLCEMVWNGLKGRYNYSKTIILPKAWYWMHMSLQVFKMVIEYNATLFKSTPS